MVGQVHIYVTCIYFGLGAVLNFSKKLHDYTFACNFKKLHAHNFGYMHMLMKYMHKILMFCAHDGTTTTCIVNDIDDATFSSLSLLDTYLKYLNKAKKMYVSKLPCAFVFRCAFVSTKFKLFIFFLKFFSSFFYELACLSKYKWEDMTDIIKHFEQQTSSTLCSVLYQVVHPKIKFHIHTEQSCDRLKLEMSAAQEKKMLKKVHFGQVFQFVTSFETENFFSLA